VAALTGPLRWSIVVVVVVGAMRAVR